MCRFRAFATVSVQAPEFVFCSCRRAHEIPRVRGFGFLRNPNTVIKSPEGALHCWAFAQLSGSLRKFGGFQQSSSKASLSRSDPRCKAPPPIWQSYETTFQSPEILGPYETFSRSLGFAFDVSRLRKPHPQTRTHTVNFARVYRGRTGQQRLPTASL